MRRHQMTVFYAATSEPEDKPMKARAASMYFFGLLMVLCQTWTAITLWTATPHPRCQYNEQCMEGTFCDATDSACKFCSQSVPLAPQIDTTGTLLHVAKTSDEDALPKFNVTLLAEVCANPTDQPACDDKKLTLDECPESRKIIRAATVAFWCEACVHTVDLSVRPITLHSLYRANVSAMQLLDWLVLAFASFVASLSVLGELKDIQLCEISIEQAGDKLTTRWRLGLKVLCGLRRWSFLPCLMLMIPRLVMLQGGKFAQAFLLAHPALNASPGRR